MLSCLCLGKGITGAQLLSGVERVCRCCAPALPWPLVCPIPLCPKGKLALPEASKRYFSSMAKHQGRFESALPQCFECKWEWIWGILLAEDAQGFSLLLLGSGTDSSGITCSKKQNFGADGTSVFKTPGTDRALLVQPAPPQCSRNSVTLQLWWKCTSQNAF